jgi:hypothetical protein
MLDTVTQHSRCVLGASTAPLKVSVGIHGGHSGVFAVDLGGAPLPHDPDGKVPLGPADKLIGKAIVITTVVNQVAGSSKFTAVRVIDGPGFQCVSTIDGQFDQGSVSVVSEIVDFSAA